MWFSDFHSYMTVTADLIVSLASKTKGAAKRKTLYRRDIIEVIEDSMSRDGVLFRLFGRFFLSHTQQEYRRAFPLHKDLQILVGSYYL